jgi:hypothetical protein
MNRVLKHSDECPHCCLPLEILSIKLGLRGTAMVYACMNCAMTRTENPKQQVLSASFRRAPGDRGKVRSAFFYCFSRARRGARQSTHETHVAPKDPQEQSGS